MWYAKLFSAVVSISMRRERRQGQTHQGNLLCCTRSTPPRRALRDLCGVLAGIQVREDAPGASEGRRETDDDGVAAEREGKRPLRVQGLKNALRRHDLADGEDAVVVGGHLFGHCRC